MYAIRLHELDGVGHDGVASFLRSLDGSHFLVEETEASRKHFQGWIRTTMKMQALRVAVKRKFPSLVGNKGYSLTTVRKEEEYMRYCCKGTKDAPPVVVSMYGLQTTDEWVANEYKAYWEHELADAREAKKKKGTVTENIWEAVRQLQTVDIDEVTTIIIREYVQAQKPYDVYGVRRLRNVIMSHYSPKYCRLVREEVNSDAIADAYNRHKVNLPECQYEF